MLAIILAGGKGERLRPLTENLPKVLVPVQGTTLLEQVIALVKTAGVDEIILSTSYLAEKIRAHFSHRPAGVRLRYLEEPRPRGTAGPLMMLKETGQAPRDDFLLVNGDNLYALDFSELAGFHRAHGGMATIALHAVSDPTAYGVAQIDGDRIAAFVEKPARDRAPSNWINSGYAMMSPAVFAFVPQKDFAMNEYDIYPAVAQAGKLFGYRGSGQWFDTGTPERYQQVQREWRGPRKVR